MMKCPPPHTQVYKYKENLSGMERFLKKFSAAILLKGPGVHKGLVRAQERSCSLRLRHVLYLARWGTLLPWLNQCLGPWGTGSQGHQL